MKRAQEKTTTATVDADQDENYQFSGATLKISSNDSSTSPPQNTSIAQGNTFQPASSILSGSDVTSMPYQTGNNPDIVQVVPEPVQPTVYVKPKVGTPKHFFSFRHGLFEQAVKDCVNVLLRATNDTDLIGSWLLTEISHWDHERERIFILTTKTLLEVKYDFISLRILQYKKIRLEEIDTILKGKITYPQTSFLPKIEGLTNGVASLISGGFAACNEQGSKTSGGGGLALANRFNFSSFKPIDRSDFGIRVMWNKGQPLPLLTSWNPFTSDIPWKTIINHPLYSYKDPFNSPHIMDMLEKNQGLYSVDGFYDALLQTISNNNIHSTENTTNCKFTEGPIIMENYVWVGAMIHNKNNFGFFKVRGKFSF